MHDPDLEPHVQEILEEVLEEKGLDPSIAYTLLERAQTLEGDELDDSIRRILRSA